MVIHQGEMYWADVGEGTTRPVLVIQNDLFNHSQIGTVVVCALTSNTERGKAPGNVALKKGEANLPKASVVNISQLATLSKSDLEKRVGKLSQAKLDLVFDGLKLLLEPV